MDQPEQFILPDRLAIVGRTVVVEVACAVRYLPRQKIVRAIETVLAGEAITDARVVVVLCDDITIRTINAEFLQHDWATDVISFALTEAPLDGEVYISVETAQRQADEYNVSLHNELVRLAVHGTLHLVGYNDTTESERQLMYRIQEQYVQLVMRSTATPPSTQRPRSSAG
ncbi:MAG: rRNA maturation RNase YbeY [Chlorobi bacterium]|nr:rRNA maturation RNase YbeY [Chlorobiota bacterium]